MSQQTRVIEAFEQRFGVAPTWIARAPGRVNLIGEHTDYNDGFVLPMAIDRAIWIALRRRDDRRVLLHSLDFDEPREFALDGEPKPESGWIDYVAGVAWALQESGQALCGFEGTLCGDVPAGAGLSSSAALEMAAARAFASTSEFDWDPQAMARIGQRAENEFVGVSCGIMDQLISAAAAPGSALLIDCRDLTTEAVPLPENVAVAILDTGTRRALVDSAYNERRQSCEAAARHFDVPALRDLDLGMLTERSGDLDHEVLRRARHVVSENARTLAAAAAMRRDDARALGRLMDESHTSLARDFEVSSPALDRAVEATRKAPGCLGARMTGAGFGGCAVALVERAEVEAFVERVNAVYPATITITEPSAGAELISSPAEQEA